jgi:integrase
MALWKRGGWYWADFTVNGERFRLPLDTSDRREASNKEKDLIGRAQQGKLAPTSLQFARLSFGEAADRYQADRLAHLAPRTRSMEKDRLKPLRDYFGATSLNRISADAILSYIPQRKAGGLANRTINMELGILRRILKKAKRWYMVADDIKPLPERHDVGRALAHDEKVRLLKIAGCRVKWQIAYNATILSLNTTMRSCEIRGLCWRDVDFIERTLTVRRSKTDAGQRMIPLNSEAWIAVLQMRDRARTLFGDNPHADWYIFPHAEGNSKPNPTKPMSGWRTA